MANLVGVGFVKFTDLMWSVKIAVSIHKLNVIRRDMFEGLAGLVCLCLRQRQTLHHLLVPPLSLWFPVEQVTRLGNNLPQIS